jgi:hypothetical protein
VTDPSATEEARSALIAAQRSAESANHDLTRVARRLLTSGALALGEVLEVVNISRATWYRRLEALREWEATGSETTGDT